MAKTLLKDFKISGDVIDQVISDGPVKNSGENPFSPESPPVGSEHAPHDGQSETEPPCDALRVETEGLGLIFSMGGTRYRVSGVKPVFVTSLRVNIRAMVAESGANAGSYYDSLDLYSARARSSFALALSRVFEREPQRIEKDLVQILEYLEKERDRELSKQGEKSEHRITPEEEALGMELLKDPRLFDRIVGDLSALGYMGEDVNKELLYLCASSRKLDDPISVLILSQSASGKSFLVECVRRLMPAEDVVAVTSLSDQALNYIDDLRHKFLILGEAVHSEVIEHQIREMLSGKELSRLVTVKDAETGKMQSHVVRTPVIVSSVMSGTNYAINPENASRCFVVNTDESQEQTERIQKNQRQKYSLERLMHGTEEVARIIERHQAAQRLLKKVNVVNDFAPLLDFPTSLMRLRRDHDRFLDLIACVCFVRQVQKKEETVNGLRFIRCDLEDYRIAYRIMVEGVLSSTLRELPKSAISIFEQIKGWVKQEAAKQSLSPEEISFSQRQIREATGLGHTWVKNHIRQLVDYEYLVFARGGLERCKSLYRIKDDATIIGADLSMIPTPEAMEKKLSGRA